MNANNVNTTPTQKEIENAKKVPEWLQYAFVKASESIKYNCSWGFISAKEAGEDEFKSLEADFKANNGRYVLVAPVSNGYVFELIPGMMQKIFKTVMPEFPDAAIAKYMTENQKIYNQGKEECSKLIDKIVNGKLECKAVNGFKVVDFGLYCVNLTTAIKEEDSLYKSFKLSFESFKKLLDSKGVTSKFYVSDGKHTPVPITSASAAKMMKIADSNNGVIFKLCYKN